MNRKNIEKTIEIMKRNQVLNKKLIEAFPERLIGDVSLMGSIGTSPEFFADGGKLDTNTYTTTYKGYTGVASIAAWLELDLKTFDDLVFNSYGLYGKSLVDITSDDVIEKLQKMLEINDHVE